MQEGAFEVEIKGTLEVTIELHLKMRMVVHLLGHKGAQNEGTNLSGQSISHLKMGALKNAHKCEEKDAFYAAFEDPLDSAIKRYT